MSDPGTTPPSPLPPETPPTRTSSAYRSALAVFCALAAVLVIAGMVRYTRRVEAKMVSSTASAESVSLLRDRVEAPLFSAPEIDGGGTFSLAAYRGKKIVLVNFWATWCPPCREEIPELIALQNRYKDQLQIIGIAQDSGSAADVEAFARKVGINYPVVIGTPEIERGFPPTAYLPTTFIVDRDGKIAQKHVGMLNASLTESETRVLAGLEPNAKIVYTDDNEKARLASAAEANRIPGVNLDAVPAGKRGDLLKALNEQHCTCGCDLTIAQCRLDDPTCGISLPLAQDLVKQIAGSK